MFKIDISVPQHEQVVGVRTTENRGFTPEELAEQCVRKKLFRFLKMPIRVSEIKLMLSQKHVEKACCILYATG